MVRWTGTAGPGRILPPEPFRTIQYDVFCRDRLWFEAHPGATEYRREYVPGEFWPHDQEVDCSGIEYVSIRMGVLEEDRGLVRVWSVYPPVLFGGGDGEDAVNWMVRARDEGLPHDGPCPRCGTPAAVTFFHEPWQGASFWLRCPDCRVT